MHVPRRSATSARGRKLNTHATHRHPELKPFRHGNLFGAISCGSSGDAREAFLQEALLLAEQYEQDCMERAEREQREATENCCQQVGVKCQAQSSLATPGATKRDRIKLRLRNAFSSMCCAVGGGVERQP